MNKLPHDHQKLMDELAALCTCRGRDRPCEGLLAGGMCDDIDWREDPEEILMSEIPNIKTPEELEAQLTALKRDAMGNKIAVAREAILNDLRRRWKEGPTPEHGITAPRDISRFYQPQTNYFCGAGIMDCPVCRTGKLRYSRSSYNGHVNAKCSTETCVGWME